MPKIRATITPAVLDCPFCGGGDLEIVSGTKESEGIPMQIVCCDCAAHGPIAYVSDEQSKKITGGGTDGLQLLAAMSYWNIRVER